MTMIENDYTKVNYASGHRIPWQPELRSEGQCGCLPPTPLLHGWPRQGQDPTAWRDSTTRCTSGSRNSGNPQKRMWCIKVSLLIGQAYSKLFLFLIVPLYTFCLAENEVISSITKNTASDLFIPPEQGDLLKSRAKGLEETRQPKKG